MTPHSLTSPRPWLAGLGLTLLLVAAPALADTTPRVLHVFSNTGAKEPHAPPIYLHGVEQPTLAGLTPSGSEGFGHYYSLDLSSPEAAFSSESFPASGYVGLYTGLAELFDGTVLLGSTPYAAADPTVFRWTMGEAPGNAVTTPEDPTDDTTGFGSSFRPRGLFAVDADDNTYFGGGGAANGNTLFRLSSSGELVALVDFENYRDGTSTRYAKGQYPAALVVDDESNRLYGINVRHQSDQSGDPDAVPEGDETAGTLFEVDLSVAATDGTTPVTVLHTFARQAEGEIIASDSGLQALAKAGEWLYGTTNKALWRYRLGVSESFSLLHIFGEELGDGITPWGPLVVAADGNVYGTARRTVTEEGQPRGAGILFRVVIGKADDHADDQYEILHRFDVEADGAFPVGLYAGPVEGQTQTLYGATKRGGNEGDTVNANDADGFGTVFAVDIELPVTADIQLSADPQNLTLNESITLTWSVSNADNCSGEGDWAGVKATEGSETITPSVDGELTFILACVDANNERVETSVTVTVEPAEDGDNGDDSGGGSSSGGGGGALSLLWLSALVLLTVRHRRRFSL